MAIISGYVNAIAEEKFLFAPVALVALGATVPALAADLGARTYNPYTKAPPAYVAPLYNWTGFYIGATYPFVAARQKPGVFLYGAPSWNGATASGQMIPFSSLYFSTITPIRREMPMP